MRKYGNFRRKYPKKSVRKTRKSSRRCNVSKCVKSYVKKTIHRLAENKTIGSALTLPGNPTNAASSGWVTNNVYPLSPNDTTLAISQNASQSGRIANKIRIAKAVLKFVLVPRIYDAATNGFPQPIEVRMFIFSFKNQPVEGVNGSINQFTGLFQNGSGSVGLSNSMADQMNAFNSDVVNVVYQQTFKLGFAAYEGTASVPAAQYYQNNDFKLNVKKTLNVTKYLSKQYGFNDSAHKPTSGKAMYVAFIPTLSTGGSIGASQQMFQIWYDFKLDFEDM